MQWNSSTLDIEFSEQQTNVQIICSHSILMWPQTGCDKYHHRYDTLYVNPG